MHPRADAVAGHGALHEHDVAVQARDAGAAVGERLDGQLELVAVARARAAWCGGLGHGHLLWQAATAGAA